MLQRVTRGRLRAYFRALRAVGCADYTIIARIARFNGLSSAVKILAPGQDVSWVRRPDGVTVSALLPRKKRSLMVPDSGVLFRWAVDMMDAASSPRDYRDGLLLALLAARGRRLRSMALLCVGQELILRGERYRIELTSEQVKTGKPDRFDLPAQLTPYIRHYLNLTVVQPALLGGRVHDALWVNLRGEPWSPACMAQHIRLLSRQRFGESFGPHRFRIATTATLRDPTSPGWPLGCWGFPGRSSKSTTTAPAKARLSRCLTRRSPGAVTKLRRAAAQTNRPPA